MLIQNQLGTFVQLPIMVCPECGEHVSQQVEPFLQECDRCLSKKEE